jgi:MoaA/NifB/PqqE/SkfB family radical SAM enzyme
METGSMSTKGIAGDKMLSHIGRIAGDYRPITADIFLNNYCNNACPYCTYKRWELDNGAYYMRFADFVRYAKRLKSFGVQGFILTGGGEPTISKDFEAITAWMEAQGLKYGINTNFNKLVFFSPEYLKISLDAWDEDSYEKRRGVRKYATVRENIQRYIDWKCENSPGTTVGIQCVVNDPGDVERFYSANCDLGVDYMVFRPLESTGGKAYKSSEAMAEARQIIETIDQLSKNDPRVTLNFKWHLLGAQEKTCVAAWAQIAINERGEVMYCCHKPYQIVGHIMDDDILEKKNAAKTDMRGCDIPCRMTAPNNFVARTMEQRKNSCFI